MRDALGRLELVSALGQRRFMRADKHEPETASFAKRLRQRLRFRQFEDGGATRMPNGHRAIHQFNEITQGQDWVGWSRALSLVELSMRCIHDVPPSAVCSASASRDSTG